MHERIDYVKLVRITPYQQILVIGDLGSGEQFRSYPISVIIDSASIQHS